MELFPLKVYPFTIQAAELSPVKLSALGFNVPPAKRSYGDGTSV